MTDQEIAAAKALCDALPAGRLEWVAGRYSEPTSRHDPGDWCLVRQGWTREPVSHAIVEEFVVTDDGSAAGEYSASLPYDSPMGKFCAEGPELLRAALTEIASLRELYHHATPHGRVQS